MAHVAVSPLHQNMIRIDTVIKHIDNMQVISTQTTYLHQVVALEGRINALSVLIHICNASGTRTHTIHCKLIVIVNFHVCNTKGPQIHKANTILEHMHKPQ